jgi:hypothetical protein
MPGVQKANEKKLWTIFILIVQFLTVNSTHQTATLRGFAFR